MKAGKIALVSVLILASAGLIYAGYRLIKNAVKNMKEKAVAKYLNSKDTTDEDEAKNTAGSDYIAPSNNVLTANITWAAEGDPLKIGAIGVGATSGVQRLQTALNSKKSAGLTVDGYFGSLTETALLNGYEVKEILLSDLTKLEAGTFTGTSTTTTTFPTKATEITTILPSTVLGKIYNSSATNIYSAPNASSPVKTFAKDSFIGLAINSEYEQTHNSANPRWFRVGYLNNSNKIAIGYVDRIDCFRSGTVLYSSVAPVIGTTASSSGSNINTALMVGAGLSASVIKFMLTGIPV